eukprot:m.17850 g.17850  ORF g.17850 m.17850 type:complete len:79 (+) comp29683_c0_seq1:372-608(+)
MLTSPRVLTADVRQQRVVEGSREVWSLWVADIPIFSQARSPLACWSTCGSSNQRTTSFSNCFRGNLGVTVGILDTISY